MCIYVHISIYVCKYAYTYIGMPHMYMCIIKTTWHLQKWITSYKTQVIVKWKTSQRIQNNIYKNDYWNWRYTNKCLNELKKNTNNQLKDMRKTKDDMKVEFNNDIEFWKTKLKHSRSNDTTQLKILQQTASRRQHIKTWRKRRWARTLMAQN
jgi:hypothetical protein